MSLKIRLSRGGTKKRPHYSIVVAESRSPRDGRFIDRLGFYNPLLPKDHADRLKLDLEKAKAWLAKQKPEKVPAEAEKEINSDKSGSLLNENPMIVIDKSGSLLNKNPKIVIDKSESLK